MYVSDMEEIHEFAKTEIKLWIAESKYANTKHHLVQVWGFSV